MRFLNCASSPDLLWPSHLPSQLNLWPMDNEVHFRTLEATGFHTASEHPELASNPISVLDRLYDGHPSINLTSAMQPFALPISGSQPPFDILSHSLPVQPGVSIGGYELHNSNDPLPPPQSPQFLNADNNIFRAISNGVDSFPSHLRSTQLAGFFVQSSSPDSIGKIKCRLCAKAFPSTLSASALDRHLATAHRVATALASEARRNFVSRYFLPSNPGAAKGKRRCAICDAVYSSTTSSSILSRHLSKMHHINPKAEVEPDAPSAGAEARTPRLAAAHRVGSSPHKGKGPAKGTTPSQVWAHFSRVDITNKDGTKFSVKKCHHCDKAYSVTTSNSGLARHLFSVHPIRLASPRRETPHSDFAEKHVASPVKEPKLIEPEEEALDCDSLTGAFFFADPIELKDIAPHSDGLTLLRRCRHCGKAFDLASSKHLLFQHLSASHSIHFQPFVGLEEYGAAPVPCPLEDFPKGPKPEARDCRFLQMLLSKFILSNPEPMELLQNPYFQALIQCFDARLRCPGFEEGKALASSLEGIRNLQTPPDVEANPVFVHFLVQGASRQCLYCHYAFPKATPTFTLSRHLGSAHLNLFPEGFPPPRRSPPLEASANALQQLASRVLITSLRPAAMLEQELFQKFLVLVGFLEPPLSAQAIAHTIVKQYRDQLANIEALLKSAISRVTLIVDLFGLRCPGAMLIVTFSFVDSCWQPRRIVASANWYGQAASELDLEGVAGAVLFNMTRCQELQLRVASFVLNVRIRAGEFKDLLERRLREKLGTAVPFLPCVSGMIDDSLLLALQEHSVTLRLQRMAQSDTLLLGSDWRGLHEALSNSKQLLAEGPISREHVSRGDWEELCFFLGRLSQLQRAALSLYDSRHPTLSEAYVALKGLSDQLFDFVDPSQPQISPPHYLATFLDPRFKLRVFGDRASTVVRLKKMLTIFSIEDPGVTHATTCRPTFGAVAATFFAPRPAFLELRVPRNLEEEFNLERWSAHHLEFPILHRVALEHLAIPASGLFLLPEQAKLAAFPTQSNDLLPILALWAHHRYCPPS
ncbi:hypothetical protein L0F63_001200 [Massospora cicadina]|nr:hypothetical protein L0F63_001200 [Massospora cicadina]